MAIKKEELQIIGEYVQEHLSEWLPEKTTYTSNISYPIELTERMIRVEEELKIQRELMKQGFEGMDKRFVLMQHNIDKRFEQVDKRFEQVDKHFEQVDKHFESLERHFDKRFTMMFSFITIGFVVIATMMSVFQFLG